MTTPIRFAILGYGHHATRRLVPAFAASRHATLAGIWRRDQAAAAQLCAAHAIPLCFPTAEALCASPDIDVVFITSPDAMHRHDTLLAFSHNKAVLCEKPVSMNAAEAESMAAAARSASLLYGVAQNFRYNRSVEWLRDKVRSGAIGDPQLAHALYSYPAQFAPRKWIADPTLACGGPIADVGVHCIDTLRFILDRDVTSISTLARQDDTSGQVESIASMQLEMSGRLFAHISATARAPYRSLIEITGSNGVLIAENCLTVDRPVDLVLRRAGDLIESLTVENNDGYTRMIDDFALAFRGQSQFAATGEDAIRNMQALDAAYASWRTGTRQTLAP